MRGVLDGHAGVFELVADRVGGGPVLALPRRRALFEGQRHQTVHCGPQVAAAGTGPVRVQRVEPEDAEHGPDTAERRRRVRALGEGGVARAYRLVHHRERPRGVEVVVHRLDELGRQLLRRNVSGPLHGVGEEVLQALVRGRRLAYRLLRVVDDRAVVRRGEVVAQLDRADPQRRNGFQVDHVADRLAHLGRTEVEQRMVYPVPGEPESGRPGLGDLVLVVREHQIQATAVDVELVTQVPPAHRRALDVPARPARPPRRGPERVGRLVLLLALPQREVARVALGPLRRVGRRLHRVDPLPGQRAVVRVRTHVEVHVAGAVVGHVRVPGLDQPLDQLVHLRDVPGRPRLIRRRQDTERPVRPREDQLVLVRDRPERPLLLKPLGQYLVVDIGDVADEPHLVPAVLQPAPEHVVVDPRAEVADVRPRLDGEPAQVDAGLAG